MADDRLSAALAEISETLTAGNFAELHKAARTMKAALEAVLELHGPRERVAYEDACRDHLIPEDGCPSCQPPSRRTVCPECRDQFGDPVLIADCRVRERVLAGLAKGDGSGG